jgi:hypothetical protein
MMDARRALGDQRRGVRWENDGQGDLFGNVSGTMRKRASRSRSRSRYRSSRARQLGVGCLGTRAMGGGGGPNHTTVYAYTRRTSRISLHF